MADPFATPGDKSYPVTPLGYPARLLEPDQTFESVNRTIEAPLFGKLPGYWLPGFFLVSAMLLMFLVAVTYLIWKGVGIWGINIPIAWGFAIVNFVWWIGIGHAGTFISAILLLLMQKWRTAINRLTEAMTLFAVICAGMFPLLHLGRPWVFYWLFPYPDTMKLWPQFRSPLVWDVFAVSTYFTVSLIFWYIGLVPDLATIRDRAQTRTKQVIYGILAMGWRGSGVHWQRHQMAYLLLAGLATPLVLSVHSVVSLDFAVAILPGWHSTIFPPYFVAGAIYSGFSMVLNLLIPIRKLYHLETVIPLRYMNNAANIMLATGWMVAFGYIMEAFMSWYSGDVFEQYMMWNRAFGPYGWVFWLTMTCNVFVPQALWSRYVRTHMGWLWIVALFINAGMWLERFMIVISSLNRDFVPSMWRMFYPTAWDWMTLFGTVGLFLTLLFLFIRFLPLISISEVRELVAEEKEGKA